MNEYHEDERTELKRELNKRMPGERNEKKREKNKRATETDQW